MMKKLISIIAGIFILCMALPVSADSEEIAICIDNVLLYLTDVNYNYVYPIIQNGTTYVPLRGVAQALGCDVHWDGNNRNVLIYKEMYADNSVFRNNSGEIKLYVDNVLIELKDVNGNVVKPFIINGTTYVPLRGVAQALGCDVYWDSEYRTVRIYDQIDPSDYMIPTELSAEEAEEVLRAWIGDLGTWVADEENVLVYDETFSYNGKKYYQFRLKGWVFDHASTLTTYIISADGTEIFEGEYRNGYLTIY